jgi:hypothetical protein
MAAITQITQSVVVLAHSLWSAMPNPKSVGDEPYQYLDETAIGRIHNAVFSQLDQSRRLRCAHIRSGDQHDLKEVFDNIFPPKANNLECGQGYKSSL